MLLKASKKPAKRLVEWLSKNHFFFEVATKVKSDSASSDPSSEAIWGLRKMRKCDTNRGTSGTVVKLSLFLYRIFRIFSEQTSNCI